MNGRQMSSAPRPNVPLIDVCGTAYDAESWRANLMYFAQNAPGYLHFFGATFAKRAGVDFAAYQTAMKASPAEAVELLLAGGGLPITVSQLLQQMCAQNMPHQVLFGSHTPLPDGSTVNDRVAAMANQAPERLQAWAALDLANPQKALTELDRCVNQLGMKGATMIPFASGLDPDSRACHEIYGAASELRVPLWIHTGMSFASNRPIDACTWMHIDKVAVDHPRLTIIAGHGGWPWILDGMAVLQRHRNVYLEFSAHRAKFMARTGSGWEPLLFYGRHTVRDQILFGSAGFVQQLSPRELAEEVVDLNLGEDVTRAWLHDNAARLLKLPLRHADETDKMALA